MSEICWKTEELTEGRTNDRVPPRGFLEKMRRAMCDDALDAVWNEKKERWCITRNIVRNVWRNGVYGPRDIVVPVCTVKNPDGSWRDLDDRVIDWLKESDSRGIDMSAYLAEMHEKERKAEERDDQRMVDEIKDRMLNNPKALRDFTDSLPSPLLVKRIQSVVVDGYRDERPITPMFEGASK